MTLFSESVDDLFECGDLAVAGVYSPASGTPVPVQVMLREKEEGDYVFETGTITSKRVADIRVSEVSSASEGDTLTIDGTSYTIAKPQKLDPDKLIWSFDLID